MNTSCQQWTLSPHASLRADQMGLTAAEIRRAATDPDISYPAPAGAHPPGRRVHVCARIAAVMDGGTVITLLWHGAEHRTFHAPVRA
jgi:hypothetical protein